MPPVQIALLFAVALLVCGGVWGIRRLTGKRAERMRFVATPEESAPAWAAFFTTPQWTRFVNEVRMYFHERQIPISLSDGVVRLNDPQTGANAMGLHNLAQLCNQSDETRWKQLITRHFDSTLTARQEQEEADAKLKDFNAVKDMLTVRINQRGFAPETALIAREDVPGTLSYLTIDLPTTIRNVHPDEARPWGKTHDELFEIALENVARLHKPEVSKAQLPHGAELVLLSGQSFFIASHALLLDIHAEALGGYGSLIAVPHRHCVLAFPIEDLKVVQTIQHMVLITRQMHQDGPGSITPNLFWYHLGKFILLPYEIKDKTLNFAPPEEFVEMLNGLKQEKAD